VNAIAKFPSLEDLNVATPDGVTLEHLSPTIGSVVHGIDLTKPLEESSFQFLHDLLLRRQVIFFRDQDLSLEQHLDLCRRWGTLEVIPFLKHHDVYPELLHIKRDKTSRSYENIWHHDVTWRTEPSMASMLRSVIVPDIGGDTMFSDMYAAYEGLPDAIKRACEGLEAVHSINVSLGAFADADTLHKYSKQFPPATHPVIRVHPETGRKLIFVNRAHTSHIKGMHRDDSRYLLNFLYEQAAKPEYQCRFRWAPNSIAFWDNRACQHYAVADYFPKDREMYRVTIAGDQPH